ncbi:MAG: MFS transporter [Actinomycetota bacterium]
MTTSTEPVSPSPPPWREVFTGARGRLTAGLLLLEALLAMEALIVVTILPAVERDLGGLSLYGWTFTAYTLASLASVPISGRVTDRVGATPVLGVTLVLYVGGLVIAAAAPSMEIVVLGRFVQGIGGGGVYTVSLAAVAKTYSDRIRPRVMALLASMWILPGLFGPIAGSVIAGSIGWRWAFLAPIPALALGVLLVIPALSGIGAEPDESRLPILPSLLLMLGTGLFLGGLTRISWATIPLVIAGLGIGLPGLARITPPGTLLARPGLPAAAVAAFLASAAFLAVDGFLTLMLTKVRGLSVGEAGLVVTAAAVSWAGGSWYQSSVVARRGARWLTTVGGLVLALGTVLVAGGLIRDLPIALPYAGWALGGLGMGIVFPTIPLSVMGEAAEGREAGDLSPTILMDFLGIGVGAGLGGASVALADAGRISLEAGIAGAFAIGLLASLRLVLVGRRIPDARPVHSAT